MALLSELRTRISAELGLDNTASSAEQTLIDSWVNRGVRDVLLRTQCYVLSTTLALTAGVSDYTLSTTILSINDIFSTSASQDWQFDRVSADEILRMRRASATGGVPLRYYALNGANMLMIYPTPSSGDTVTYYYVPRPALLATGTDSTATQGIPDEFEDLVEWFAEWRGGSYSDDSGSGGGDKYAKLYMQGVRDARRLIRRKGGRRLPRAVAARQLRRPIPPTPSTDFRF